MRPVIETIYVFCYLNDICVLLLKRYMRPVIEAIYVSCYWNDICVLLLKRYLVNV